MPCFLGYCYFEKIGRTCSRGGQSKIAKDFCCCKINGQGHGPNCDACPVKGSSKCVDMFILAIAITKDPTFLSKTER